MNVALEVKKYPATKNFLGGYLVAMTLMLNYYICIDFFFNGLNLIFLLLVSILLLVKLPSKNAI